MKVDALILAGGRTDAELAELSSEKLEALIKIGDRPMIEYVIRAVNRTNQVGRIAIVGPREELKSSVDQQVDLLIEAGDTMIENVQRGLEKLASDNYVLLITSDIPLIKSDVIDEFITACQDEEADIYYPIIPKQNNLARFPGIERTYVQLSEGTFTGGNMVVIRPEALLRSLDWLEKAVNWRKKPLKLSRLLGIKILFKLIIGNLSLEEIEARISKLLGCKGRGLITEHPEVGFDVDKPSDLKMIREKFVKSS